MVGTTVVAVVRRLWWYLIDRCGSVGHTSGTDGSRHLSWLYLLQERETIS